MVTPVYRSDFVDITSPVGASDPPGASQGDLLIYTIQISSGTAAALPSGWSSFSGITNTNIVIGCLVRGSTAPNYGSYAPQSFCSVIAIKANTWSGILSDVLNNFSYSAFNSTSFSVPALPHAPANTSLVLNHVVCNAGLTFTPPAGFTYNDNGTVNPAYGIASELNGGIGPYPWTASSARVTNTFAIGIPAFSPKVSGNLTLLGVG